MTDYNDGKIHGWNGGDCPVHPETVVRYWMREDGASPCRKGRVLDWTHLHRSYDIIAFQVVKQFVEPKVIWVNEYGGLSGHAAHDTEERAKRYANSTATRIAVKYVEAIADAKEVKE